MLVSLRILSSLSIGRIRACLLRGFCITLGSIRGFDGDEESSGMDDC